MPKVVVVAKVKDLAKWEAGFRTHGALFKTYSITKPVNYGTVEGNYCAACFEPEDMGVFMTSMKSAETQAAMATDGLIPETVKVFVLDKDLKL